MIPEIPPADLPASERLVFEVMRDRTPDVWTAIVRPSWTDAKNRRGASEETDLILLIPGRGILVLEVKGGLLSVERGQWFRELPNGRKVPLEKGPDRQAEDAVGHLVRYFKGVFGKDRPSIEHAVIFTGGRMEGELGPSLPPDIVITRDDLADPQSAIDRVCNYWGGRLASTATTDQIKRTIDLLMPSGEIRFDLRARTLATEQQIHRETRRQIRLTEQQLTILRGINGVSRAVIYGGPGTGKTILALERARRLAASGANVLIVCATTGIGAFLYTTVNSNPEMGSVVVRTITLLMREIAEQSDARLTSLKALNRKWFQSFDALVIDEGQDFSRADLETLVSRLRDPDTAPIYIFADPNQAKLTLPEPDQVPERIWNPPPWRHETYLLRDNCRNTHQIVRFAADLLGDDSDKLEEASVAGPEPELVECKPQSVVQTTMGVIERLLLSDGYAPGDIGLAVPANAARDYRGPLAKRNIRTIPGTKISLLGQPQADRLDIASPRHFLGLERHIMVVVPPTSANELEGSLDGIALLRRWIFIGVTRARTHCIVVCTPYAKQLIEDPQRDRFATIDNTIRDLVSQFELSGGSPSLFELGVALQREIGKASYQLFGRNLVAHLGQVDGVRLTLTEATPTVRAAGSHADSDAAPDGGQALQCRVAAHIIDMLLSVEARDTRLLLSHVGQELATCFGRTVYTHFGFEKLTDFIRSIPELDVIKDDNLIDQVVSRNRTSM